jgi:hypothetical protein
LGWLTGFLAKAYLCDSMADMRFRAMSAVLGIFLSAIATPVFASQFTFSRTLCLGDTGTAVANLQQFLIDNGDATLTVTSYFGSRTRASVVAFQTSQDLTATGCTGPLTRSRIAAIEAQHTRLVDDAIE